MRLRTRTAITVLMLVAAGCAKKAPPQLIPDAPASGASSPSTPAAAAPATPAVPQRLADAEPLTQERLADVTIANRSLDDLNRDSPFQPVFFALDSSELDDAGRVVAAANAEILKRYPGWTVTIEGHCDERGTAEYNLALGERRAVAVRTYLVSVGIPTDRLRTVSYGKEFPFDPGHNDMAWSKNRRAHFVITAK